MDHERPLQSIPDDELLRRLVELTRQSRHVEADLVAHIGEVDERRLYARAASPSMHAYCTEALHLSEAEAYLRIAAARASRAHPLLLAMLADGRLHLSAIALLAPLLTVQNRDALLTRASHKSKRQIEELIAEVPPRPDAPALIRRLPERRPERLSIQPSPLRTDAPSLDAGLRPAGAVTSTSSSNAPSELCPDGVAPALGPVRPAVVEPLAPARYKVQFTASAELRDKLERLKDLLRSSVPDGDIAAIIEDAVTEKLQRLEARRFARTNAPRKTLAETKTAPASRHIPAAVRRAVHERDGGRCRCVDAQGRRCTARDRLEFHHRHPFGYGGDHSPDSVCLMCRTHNGLLAEIDYGSRGASSTRPRSSPAPG